MADRPAKARDYAAEVAEAFEDASSMPLYFAKAKDEAELRHLLAVEHFRESENASYDSLEFEPAPEDVDGFTVEIYPPIVQEAFDRMIEDNGASLAAAMVKVAA